LVTLLCDPAPRQMNLREMLPHRPVDPGRDAPLGTLQDGPNFQLIRWTEILRYLMDRYEVVSLLADLDGPPLRRMCQTTEGHRSTEWGVLVRRTTRQAVRVRQLIPEKRTLPATAGPTIGMEDFHEPLVLTARSWNETRMGERLRLSLLGEAPRQWTVAAE
jgi:hypothetical protein